MARRKVEFHEHDHLYRTIWLHDAFTLNRIELIVEHGRDWFPDSSNSAILEAQLGALLSGKTLKVAKQAGELNPNAQAALDQLFRMRDAGQIGGSHGLGSHPAYRGEHHSGSLGFRDGSGLGGA